MEDKYVAFNYIENTNRQYKQSYMFNPKCSFKSFYFILYFILFYFTALFMNCITQQNIPIEMINMKHLN